MTEQNTGAFWTDLAEDTRDPEFLGEYEAASARIATIDEIVNELDAAREAEGLSKADLARAIDVQPSTVRRLFSAANRNPTLGTVAEVATALGLRVRLERVGAAPDPARRDDAAGEVSRSSAW